MDKIEELDEELYNPYLLNFAYHHPGHLSLLESKEQQSYIESIVLRNLPLTYEQVSPETS